MRAVLTPLLAIFSQFNISPTQIF